MHNVDGFIYKFINGRIIKRSFTLKIKTKLTLVKLL